MGHRVHTVVDSPLGELTLVAADGVLAGLYLPRRRHAPPPEAFGERDPTPFDACTRQLDEYFAAERTEFDLPLSLAGTPFQRTVWAALLRIPYGQTRSYGQLAAELGQPGASRAVGAANGRNPVSIVVPCHRVIGSSGGLVGFGGGTDSKRYLLDLEQGRAPLC